MKYVKLTHRLFEPLDTIAIEFVDYDTNDEMFDTCAKVLIEENEHKHEKQINKIKTILIAIQDKCCEIEKERDELEGRTPFFLRLGSKTYKRERRKLLAKLYVLRYHHLMRCRELSEIEDDLEARTFEDYSTLKRLLKDMGYSLTSESQKGESSITIEVWHKQ